MSPTLIFLSLLCSPTTRPHTTNTPTHTFTSLPLPLPHHHPPDPIAGDPITELNGDNNNTTKPPFIFLPHHPNTTKHHHPVLCKTTLQITPHNTAKNMHDIQATTLHHFNKKKKRQSQKPLHHSLIKGRKIKRSLNNILTPRSTTPMALYDTNNNLTSDHYSLCESMGQCLTALGGPRDFQIDPQLINSLMELSPSILQVAPHPEFTETFFNNLLSNSNPVKAPGFDNSNLYLFHLAAKFIKSLLFHICSHFITNPIPKQWLTARIFHLYKKHDPHNPINYRPIDLLQTIYKIPAAVLRRTSAHHERSFCPWLGRFGAMLWAGDRHA